MVNPKLIAENYQSKTDNELVFLALIISDDLTDVAIDILKKEIAKRSIDPNIINAIKIQRRDISEDELVSYIDIIHNAKCPHCNKKNNKLNGTKIKVVSSFLVTSIEKSYRLVACKKCLNDLSQLGNTRNISQGLWSIPGGVIMTIKASLFNNKFKKMNNDENANITLLEFVRDNIGYIYYYQNNEDKINSLLSSPLIHFLNKN